MAIKIPSPLGGVAYFTNSEEARASGTYIACYYDEKWGSLCVGEYARLKAEDFIAELQRKDEHRLSGRSEFFDKSRTWDLIRSKVWRASHIGSPRAFYLMDAEEYHAMQANPGEWGPLPSKPFEVFEVLTEEARSLTFEEKCIKTLENYYYFINRHGTSTFGFPGVATAGNDKLLFVPTVTEFLPLAYGCDESEAAYVYSYLITSGWVEPLFYRPADFPSSAMKPDFAIPHSFHLTTAGYMEIDKIRRGKNESVKEAFFIRRWDPDMNAFFTAVTSEVQKRTGCKIQAVWDSTHNEKIDDRILRKIRECPVVVLDVAPEKFNVGLEAGYALALGKPIVTIKKKSDAKDAEGNLLPEPVLPFDIVTLNCYFYDIADPESLIRTLSERILIGLSMNAKS